MTSGRKPGLVRVGDLVDVVLEERGVREQVRRTGALEVWDEAVGPNIGKVASARSVSGSTLFVEVQSSAWMMELDFMKQEILDRLNEHIEIPIEKLVFLLAGS